MNRFAHSVDQFENSVDVRETLELVVALCTRFADMRGVKLDPLYPEGELHISTNPFFLENLLWCCMDHAMSATGEGKTVSISMDKMETGVRIKLAGLEGLTGSDGDVFPSERECALLGALDAEIETDAGAGHIIVKLSKKADS